MDYDKNNLIIKIKCLKIIQIVTIRENNKDKEIKPKADK